MPDVSTSAARWAIVVPVKRLTVAKTRLSDDAAVRGALALAMAEDTVCAAVSCPVVDVVIVVTDEPAAAEVMRGLGAWVVADTPDAGLNPALEHGGREALRRAPGAGVAAIASDLPSLRPDSLGRVLGVAGQHTAAVVADADGGGTTVFAAVSAASFTPRFGSGSRQAHVSAGARDITADAAADLRRDVDTVADLRDAVALGCGPSTTAALARVALLG
jgi:2-phospho-L-lactate/phosphoenolpyruvate guanylyltransferase